MEITSREQQILAILLEKQPLQSSEIHSRMTDEEVSLVTIKRALSDMVAKQLIVAAESGRATAYTVSTRGRVFAAIDAGRYCAVEPDKRFGMNRYNFDLFADMPQALLSDVERVLLSEATAAYVHKTADLPPAIEKKELERLIIELSWKSSRIEGNTYTLLDTERLLLEHTEAAGHDHQEAQMILNHKDAFTFVHTNAQQFRTLNRANLEQLHAILVKDMGVGIGLRTRAVGVVGSVYQPLENVYQIQEGVEALSSAVGRMETPYEKALLALLGISYLQPFEDGNKRASRLMANAILLAYGCAPLSYRSVDENEYREAMLVFYELNAIVPFKKIFIDQYLFAAQNYTVR